MNIITKQTYTDDLTKLDNKRSYNNHIKENLRLYDKYEMPFSMIIFDIDFFKRVNDNYGHLVGDKVLKELGSLVISNIRGVDTAFRIGGEEFALILKNTSLNNAVIVADKLRKVVEQELKTIKDQTITISLGVTQVINGDTTDSIYTRADTCLYTAKRKGRNCVVAFG
jgi:diguanylate cyclase (GGDEF)-like protein